MFKALCKIWRFILRLLKAVVDGIVEVVGTIIRAALRLGGEVWRSIFGSGGVGIGGLIGLAVLGLTGWWLWGLYSDKKEKDDERELRRLELEHERELRIIRSSYT